MADNPPNPPARKPLWRRLLKWFLWSVAGTAVLALALAGTGWWLWSSGRLIPLFVRFQARMGSDKGDPLERPWPDTNAPPPTVDGLRTDVATITKPEDFYQPTNLWAAHIHLSAKEWEAMQPKPVHSRVTFNVPQGKFPLANTNASRNGLLGVLGLDADWTTARVDFGGLSLTNVAIRFKGNGTFMSALGAVKKPLKLDLARGATNRSVAGVTVLNFGNLRADFSCLADTLAYEFFRTAGVPAPRTTFGHVVVSVENRWEARPFGLYVMVENIDAQFARSRFGTKKMGLFKPVTYDLFQDLGPDWSAYERIYDPKLPASDAQKQRVIDTAQLVTHANDADFARRAPEYFDFDEIARFVAVNSLIASYDGFLNNGQNFYLYLDPRTDRFGLIPWDLDHSWGGFPLLGTTVERERASIERPWVADHRLLERLMAVPEFKSLYRKQIEEIFKQHFDPARLAKRIDELATTVRRGLVTESKLRQQRFEEAITDEWSRDTPAGGGADMGPTRPSYELKRFLVRRHEHITAQLGGSEKGVEFLVRPAPGQK